MENETLSWTEEREQRLRSLWPDATLSARMIGNIMGMTKNQVIGKVHRLGLPKRPACVNLSTEYFEAQQAKKDAALKLETMKKAEQQAFFAEIFGEAAPKIKDGCRWIDIHPSERPKNMSIEDMHCNGPIFAKCYCKEHFERAYLKRKEKKEPGTCLEA